MYPADEYPVRPVGLPGRSTSIGPTAVAAVFDADPYRTVKALFRKGKPEDLERPAATALISRSGGWFRGADVAPDLPRDADVVSEADLRGYAAALARNGFRGPDAWYLNHEANAAYAARAVDGGRLRMPALFLGARYDATCEVVNSRLAEPQRAYVDDLTERMLDCGHWMPQERPAEVNAALRRVAAGPPARRVARRRCGDVGRLRMAVAGSGRPVHMSFDPTHVPAVRLNDGAEIPQFGFGVFQIPAEQTVTAVRTALDAGYRHIDTAQMYGNEAEVGQAIAESGVAREEIFVTTKLDNGCHGYDAAIGALDESLGKLGFDHVDLFLIHWPRPQEGRYVETWTALEKLKADGKASSIGVSNFTVEHLERLAERTGTVPAVNQIELHPQFPQAALRAYHAEHGIATEAWSPIGQGGDLLQDGGSARSPTGTAGRPRRSCCAGTSSSATSCSRSR